MATDSQNMLFRDACCDHQGFMEDSGYRFVVCVGDQAWVAIARECLESAHFFI